MYYSETLNKLITNAVWRIIRIGARPTWHIYGVSIKEYHRRMKDAGFLAKEADILKKDFKQGLLTKYILTLRSVTFDMKLCCTLGEEYIENMISRTTIHNRFCEISNKFKNDLNTWVNNITKAAWIKYSEECYLIQNGEWRPEFCDKDNDFINGIKVVKSYEIDNPTKILVNTCKKANEQYKNKYNDWGIGLSDKWSQIGYTRSKINGVYNYAD